VSNRASLARLCFVGLAVAALPDGAEHTFAQNALTESLSAPCFLREATPGAPVAKGAPDMLCLPALPGPVLVDGDLCRIVGRREQGPEREYLDLACAPDDRRLELDINRQSDGRLLIAPRPLGEARWYRPVTGK